MSYNVGQNTRKDLLIVYRFIPPINRIIRGPTIDTKRRAQNVLKETPTQERDYVEPIDYWRLWDQYRQGICKKL